jgi:uncharacterized membrane protein
MRLDLVTHIVAGAIGIASGFVALAVAKGARAHRRSGTVFVYAMLTMAFLGGTMALVYDKVPLYAAPDSTVFYLRDDCLARGAALLALARPR